MYLASKPNLIFVKEVLSKYLSFTSKSETKSGFEIPSKKKRKKKEAKINLFAFK